jgi:hypothetical protein
MTHEERDEFIHGLRELADFLDAHPTVEVPIYAMLNVFVNTKDELAAHARTATWEKVYNGNWFTLRAIPSAVRSSRARASCRRGRSTPSKRSSGSAKKHS